MARKKAQAKLAPHYIYQTSVKLDKEAVIRGMNLLRVAEKRAGKDTVISELVICGQHSELPIDENTPEGPDALRVILVYVHSPSNQVGVLTEDITYTFLRELAAMGMANR